MRTTVILILALAASMDPAFAQEPPSHNRGTQDARGNVLHVRVIDLRNSKGKEICTLYSSKSADGFPSDDSKALASTSAPIQFGAATCTFNGLAPGEYAIVTFHDENNNGQFDRDALGLPKEEYGFSNSVKPEFAPPSFNDAAFDYKGGDQWLTIKPAN